ncbi:hypothetical protein INT46_001567 [Mucor plumbeus]|uniref:Tc1-like transposase DDE domain-containing protein n=1 Tax=Mucor plumbeus TaxID=97098 RepID=A0A8H7V3E6_9FUNG|nr:hypothetical protein INT46_001567 [Mucor plumbeus]
MRGPAWFKVGTPANVKVHTRKRVNLSMIGCICGRGIISFTKVIPLKIGNAELIEKEFHSEVSAKKRKRNTEEPKNQKPLKKGTMAYNIVKYIESVMDVLGKNEMEGFFIVMNNCRVHNSKFVVDAIEKRGYKPLFMPSYSPFLSPIGECWSKVKSGIKRNPLKKGDELTPLTAEACNTATTKDCLQWVKHAESY